MATLTFKRQLVQVILGSCFFVIAGSALGYPLLLLSIFLGLYLLRLMVHLMRMETYLKQSGQQKFYSYGLVGAIFSQINALQKRYRRIISKLEQQLQRNDEWLHNMRDGVLLIDNKNRIVRINKRCENLLKLNAERDTGLSIFSQLRDPVFAKYLESGDYAEPLPLALSVIPPLWVEMSISAHTNNERLILMRDITTEKTTNQLKQDFIANLSHELRTPLTVLQGYSETLQMMPSANQNDNVKIALNKHGKPNGKDD